jgi:hypothetical protein
VVQSFGRGKGVEQLDNIENMTAEDGVIYCTSGEKYFNDAVVSAQSFKKLHPEKKVAIFTEEGAFFHEVFDYHFPIFSSQDEIDWVERYYEKQPKKWMLKVICTPKSPFRRTVHLDSDTLVVQRIDKLFDDLEHNDIIFTHLDWVKQENGRNVGLRALTVPNGINSGVYSFRNSSSALRVLGPQWRDVCEAEGFIKNEQSILSIFAREPDSFLYDVKWKIEDNVKFNATRRMWRTMYEYGLWDDVRILHFNETDKLKDVFEGRLAQDDLLKLPRVVECDGSLLEKIPPKDNRRLIHFHLAKTAGKSLLESMRGHLGDKVVSFNPSKQEEFRDRLRNRDWQVISGHLSGAHSHVRFRLKNRYRFFTVLRDPVDRFFSAYNYIKSKTPESALYQVFHDLGPLEAAEYCLVNNVDYCRNSQCSGLIWDPAKDATFENAISAIHDCYAFVCTLNQMGELSKFLYESGCISDTNAIPHINKTRSMDPALYNVLKEIIGEKTKEDYHLFDFIEETGPWRMSEPKTVKVSTIRTVKKKKRK